jgi:phosphoserine phosphatase
MTTKEVSEPRDLAALIDLARAMTSEKDLGKLLELIARETSRLLGAERTSIFLIDSKKGELFSRIAEGLEIREIRLPIGRGIAGQAAQTLRPLNIPDAYEHPAFNPEFDRKTGFRTRAVLCRPLVTAQEKAIGVIQVINRTGGGSFEARHERLLSALGSHAATALETAWLLDEQLTKQKMAQALQIARQIQANLLPRKPLARGAFEIAGASIPADETGGDYFDYFLLPGGRVAFALGDVSGHGLGAALLMATARAALRAFLRMSSDPGEVIGHLNDLLISDFGGDRFITLFVGILDAESGRLTYASAGHEPPFRYRSATGEITEIESTGIPVGILEETTFDTAQTTLAPGDFLLVTTDGIAEAVNPSEEPFGKERLKRYLCDRHNDGDPRSFLEGLFGKVAAFEEGGVRADDLTALMVRHQKPPPSFFARSVRSTLPDKNALLKDALDAIRERGLPVALSTHHLRLCLDEALANALDHGNRQDPNRTISLSLAEEAEGLVATVRDDGAGFDPAEVPDPTGDSHIEKERGRGLHLMRSLLKKLEYRDDGRTAVLVFPTRSGRPG